MTGSTTSTETGFWTISRIVAVIIGLLVIALAAANFDSIQVNFLIFKLTVPLFVLIVGSLVIGYVVGWLTKRTK